MSKKQRKRYNKPLDVHLEIRRLRKEQAMLAKRAEELDAGAKEMVEFVKKQETTPGGLQHMQEMADFERKKAIKCRRRSELIDDVHIPKLIRTLQKLGTAPMDFIKDDISVEAERE